MAARSLFWRILVASACTLVPHAHAQLSKAFDSPLDHPAIAYSEASNDPIVQLQQQIDRGSIALRFDERAGYLQSLLDALDVPVESQIAVFSKSSLQAPLIRPGNPRTIFFNNSVSVAWMRHGFIEVAAEDPGRGIRFYSLAQIPAEKPRLRRDDRCLRCHHSHAALNVPGYLVRSIPTAFDGVTLPWLGNFITTHDSPIEERWGGWYVSGDPGNTTHLGNRVLGDKRAMELDPAAAPLFEHLKGQFDTAAYLTPYSDAVALLVFDHQMHMANILTRLSWESRIALHERRPPSDVDASIAEAVDYLLFVNEAPLGRVRGTSGFAEKFAAQGPRDAQGRSLRQLRLNGRLMEHPCSYMIYSETFDNLPEPILAAFYRRMWDVLSGQAQEPKYERLSLSDRRAIVAILRDTKHGLPDYFQEADVAR